MPAVVYPQNVPINNTQPSIRREKGRSNADILKDFRAKKGTTVFFIVIKCADRDDTGISHLDETLLLRDTLYLMQGISGKYVKFSSLNEEGKRLDFPTDSVSSRPFFFQM
jgi:gamma-tubulin complex component 3